MTAALMFLALLPSAPDPRPGEAEDRQPAMGADARLPGARCPAGGCRTVVFARPTGCALASRNPGRRTMRCAGEATIAVELGPDGVVSTRPLGDRAARNPYPFELVGQWRTCPFAEDAGLEPAAVPYEDPEVGRCYVLRDVPAGPPPGRSARLGMLDTLHPYLADCLRRMIAHALAEGDEIKVISALRRPVTKTVWVTKTVKRNGKKKKVKVKRTVERGAGWHGFGLAVDVNLMHRKDLGSATRAFLDGSERAAWDRLGARGEAWGLKWLGRTDPGEIFHFEWHPTWPGLPKGKLRKQLRRLEAKGGLRAVWARLRYDASRSSPFKHLRD